MIATVLGALAVAGAAIADQLMVDNDQVQNGNQNTRNLTAAPGATVNTTADLLVVYQGSKHLAAGSSVTVVKDSAPAGFTVGGASISVPTGSAWDDNGDKSSPASASVGFTAPSTPGTYTYSVSWKPDQFTCVSGLKDCLGGTASMTINLTVVAPADSTPPDISSSITGTKGNGDWYTTDVGLSWSVTDGQSAISSQTGCDAQSLTANQPVTEYTCSATSGGGSASKTERIGIDKDPPTISGSAGTYAGGWTNQDVTVTFACADVGPSGLAGACPSSQTIGSDTASTGTNVSASVFDNAGHSTTSTAVNVKVDKTPPSVSVTGVSNGATYTLGSVPSAGCDTTDALSGVKASASASTTGTVGSVTTTCSGAEDNAGNTGSASVTYTVEYAWTGLFAPVSSTSLNTVKAGSAVPVKFSLAGDQGLAIFSSGYPKSAPIECDSNAQLDPVESTVTAGSSSLQYDASKDQYTYVWKTDKGWAGSCRQLILKLVDGTFQRANFKLTK